MENSNKKIHKDWKKNLQLCEHLFVVSPSRYVGTTYLHWYDYKYLRLQVGIY